MTLGPLIAGGIMAGAGALGMAKSSGMKVNKAKAQKYTAPEYDPNAYQYGGSADATAQWRSELAARDQAAMGQGQQLYGQGQQARGMLGDVYARQAAMADGTGPSLARAQMQRGLSQASQAAAQQAASVGGGAANQLAAQRMAQQAGAQMRMDAAGRGAEIAAQEQIAATNAMGGLAGQMRAGDLAAQQLAAQQAQAALGARMGLEQQQMGAQQAYDQSTSNASMWQQEQQGASNAAAQAANRQQQQGEKDKWWQWGTGMVSAGANTALSGSNPEKK